MIDTVVSVMAEYVEIGNELDLDGDEYCDNEYAIYEYAKVLDIHDWYRYGDPWITLTTSQGKFDIPAGHTFKVRMTRYE